MQLLDNRYRDYVGFPPLLRSGENDGKSFSDFYRASQIELFSALDNVLSQKAEDTLTEFAAVKKADIQLQTPLGNRKAQIGINIMGAFAESKSSAFGWQVRAFGGKDNIGGANAGIFFRRVDGETLYGINTFADYESGKYGDFLRYGIGGELQSPYAAFAANYYLPITDDKRQGATVAFSQKGYDANLRINIPQMDYLKLRGDYYHFDGKYGGEDDKGFRYGLELQPINDLRIGVFYDDGGEKFGGDIAYTYNFGIPQKRESNVKFSPDLFSPIVREYSQRILITTTERIEVLRTPTLTTFMTTTIPAMTTRITTGNFITLINSITMATGTITTAMTMFGMTTTTRMIASMTVATRAASVLVTVDAGSGVIATTFGMSRILATLPPATAPRPWVIQLTTAPRVISHNDARVIITPDAGIVPIGMRWGFPDANGRAYTITVVQGSEQFISITTTMITETEMTAADVITESEMTLSAAMTTRMTNAAIPTTMEVITPERMITTRMTAFLIRTITIGANTGAAKVDSHSPPSFPPSFPQMPKLALAANLRPQLSFPRRRESTRRRAANTDGAKRHLIRRGFYIPVIPA